MRVGVLGPLEVWDDGRELPLGSGRQRALFVLLLLHAEEVVSRDRLIDELWGERPPASAAKVLQGYVSQLRRRLPPESIVTRGSGYLLRGGGTDASEFERLVQRARDEEAREAALTLREALALWRGGALAEVEYEAWAQAEIARLEELRLVAIEERIEVDLRLGEDAHVVPELEALVAAHPLRERLRAQLMLALYRAGRQTGALDAFADARRRLVDELGVEPGTALRELHHAILRQDPALELPAQTATAGNQSPGAFVGRAAELAQLVTGLDDAIAGRGRLFLLVGEPGIGKSRLAEEVSRRALQRGVRVLVGRCWEAGGAPAFWPWVQSLRGYAREAPPELGALLRGEPAASDTASARFRLFDATVEFLRAASRERPLLLFLDDMHAADEPSLLLLRFLARELAQLRLLVLAACRDVDPAPGVPLATMLAEVAREPETTRISLGGLSEEAVADYVESELASRELASTLYESTEGNPLFLAETVRLITLEERIAIPQSIRDVIARRLAHMSDECNRVLAHAAVLGREFDHAALASMSDLSAEELLEALNEAMTARVVSDVPGVRTRSRFAHVLIRDTLYDSLTSARRVALHRKAATVLEDDAELAFHAMAGNDLEKARACAQRAGDRALALLAYEEAARLYQIALAADPNQPTRCELLLALGHAQVRSGDNTHAKQTFLQAAADARELRQPDAFARAALGYGGRFVWARAGADSHLVPLLGEALGAGEELDSGLRARVLARLAAALRDQADSAPRDRRSAEAVDLARTIADPATLAYTLVGRYAAIWSPATTQERLAIATEGIELAQKIGDKEREVECHGHRFHALLELGEVDAAHAELEARAALTDEMRQPAQLVVHLWLRSMHTLLVGDFESAEADIHHAFKLAYQSSLGDEPRLTFELQRFVLRREQGRLAEIEAELERSANMFPNRPVLRYALVNLATEQGRLREAESRLATLSLDSVPFDNEWLFSVSLLAESVNRLNDRTSAEAAYDLLLPYSAQNVADGTEVSTGAVARYLGLLANTIGRLDDAAHHFEQALALNEKMGARPWLAHTRKEYTRMLEATPTQLGTAARRGWRKERPTNDHLET